MHGSLCVLVDVGFAVCCLLLNVRWLVVDCCLNVSCCLCLIVGVVCCVLCECVVCYLVFVARWALLCVVWCMLFICCVACRCSFVLFV